MEEVIKREGLAVEESDSDDQGEDDAEDNFDTTAKHTSKTVLLIRWYESYIPVHKTGSTHLKFNSDCAEFLQQAGPVSNWEQFADSASGNRMYSCD